MSAHGAVSHPDNVYMWPCITKPTKGRTAQLYAMARNRWSGSACVIFSFWYKKYILKEQSSYIILKFRSIKRIIQGCRFSDFCRNSDFLRPSDFFFFFSRACIVCVTTMRVNWWLSGQFWLRKSSSFFSVWYYSQSFHCFLHFLISSIILLTLNPNNFWMKQASALKVASSHE